MVEANVLAHLPWLTEGGIDVKIPRHERARFAARQKDVEEEDGVLMLCGTRVRLV